MQGRISVRSGAWRGLMGAVVTGLVLGAGCASPGVRDAREAPELPLSEEQRQANLESFDVVWTTIRDKHFDPELNGVDWVAVRDEFRPRAEEAETMSQTRAAISEMIGRLGQTHFGIFSSAAYESLGTRRGDGRTGIEVRVVDGKALVTGVKANSPAQAAGVQTGWIIDSVDGEPLATRIEAVREAYEGKTLQEGMLVRAAMSHLVGTVGDEVRVAFLDGNDEPVEKVIPLATPEGRETRLGNFPAILVTFESRLLEGNIGYIRFSSFFDPNWMMAQFNAAMAEFKNADGIIIDLRGNPGGIGAMSMGMAGWLIREPGQFLGTMYTRTNALKFVVNSRRSAAYTGPVVLLIDGTTGSTSEIFSGGLKDLGRAHVVGTRTAGAALPSIIEKLPNGDGFQYAMANYISKGGVTLEGNGVEPDEEVRPSRAALLEGRDTCIESAIRWIEERP